MEAFTGLGNLIAATSSSTIQMAILVAALALGVQILLADGTIGGALVAL
jgi:Ca2+/H+ antiporter